MRRHRPTPGLGAHLEALYRDFPFERSFAMDPLSGVRPFASEPRSAEIAGVVASTLAVGNTRAILSSFARLRSIIHDDWTGFVERHASPGHSGELSGFKHRWVRGDQLEYLAHRLHGIYASYPSLEDLFLEGREASSGFAGGLSSMAAGLRGPANSRAPPRYRILFPSPDGSSRSPCKRLTLFVRWMARSGYPDLGLWTRVPASELRIPLDHHVFWIAYNLGLTQRRTPSWATVEEVTAALRAVDPQDPTRFDFVLCHTGVSGDCPKERDLTICGRCAVRPDCRLWRGRVAA